MIQAGLREIPENSRIAEAVRSVIADYESGMPLKEAMDKIHLLHNEDNIFEWCHIIPNEKIVVLSLLYSEGDFTRAIGNCVECAFDTDSNAAVVGAVMGTLYGVEKIESKWIAPLGGRLASTVLDESMNEIADLTERTFKIAKREITPDTRLKRRYDYNESFDIE